MGAHFPKVMRICIKLNKIQRNYQSCYFMNFDYLYMFSESELQRITY
jgi:hypothetical protein